MDCQSEPGQPPRRLTKRSTAVTVDGRPLQAETNFRIFFCERSTISDGTVDRRTRDSRPLESTGRPLRLQEVAKLVQRDFSVAQVGNQGHSHSKNIKGFTLGHFHARREPPLNVPLLERGLFKLVSKTCQSHLLKLIRWS